jgi:SpoIID/LytB domain protein
MLLVPLALVGRAFGEAAQPPPLTAATFAITGHGWGHAVGMGQWGAYGMAKLGKTYDQILAFYYPGTKLAPSPMKTIRVLLEDGQTSVTVTSKSPFRVRDGKGVAHTVLTGSLTVDPSLRLQISPTRQPRALPGPLTLVPGKSPLVAGRAYRGSIRIEVAGRSLRVENVVSIDDYARGVVTQEMPKEWPAEALEAQAVAARSYAVAVQQAGKTLYVDVRSEAYGGVDGESPEGARAVAATKKQVLLYNGTAATTYFSSSTGGRTAAITDLVPGLKPVPYLVAKKDPYDTSSPWHNWGPITIDAPKLASLLGVPGVTDLVPVPAGGHAREIVLQTPAGKKTMASSVLRSGLDLRSTFVTVGLLSLTRPAGTAAARAALTLTGSVRGIKGPVTLQSSTGGGAWTSGSVVTPATDGTFSEAVTPTRTTSYRLSAKDVKSQALLVPVSGSSSGAEASRAGRGRALAVAVGGAAAKGPFAPLFAPGDPLASQQWYLDYDRAFDFWSELPPLDPVLVGVVDTGVDANHPELAGSIAAAKSFVGGTVDDEIGHGTFVAGEIAAEINNGQGIAGIAFPAKLLVAKVVASDETIDPLVEAKAIRWQVDRGARVINLSLGAVRDPRDRKVDAFSAAEAAAVQYAARHGVLVVAAVGNGDDAPSSPWDYASYPAALPHVLGVSAIGPGGSVPTFSNRDDVFNDLAAPGEGILSTFPRSLTSLRPACVDQGYSDCGTADYRSGDGTSFAAPQVTAAAALLLAARPWLSAEQVATVLERSASDMTAGTGCPKCSTGRDRLSGWGSLDITAALQALDQPVPAPDRLEPNDDAGIKAGRLWGDASIVHATVDYWDDPIDVYRVHLDAGQRVAASLHCSASRHTQLVLWRPGTMHVEGPVKLLKSRRLVVSHRAGPRQSFTYRAGAAGWYNVEVKLASPGSGPYRLRVSKSPSAQ